MQPLAADIPLPSERVVKADDSKQWYRWLLTTKERSHISDMLSCDAEQLTLRGNIMNRDRSLCRSCGKYSGLDDLVHNALHFKIHDAPFMLDILQNGPKNGSPAHDIHCSGCGTKHDDVFYWIPSMPW